MCTAQILFTTGITMMIWDGIKKYGLSRKNTVDASLKWAYRENWILNRQCNSDFLLGRSLSSVYHKKLRILIRHDNITRYAQYEARNTVASSRNHFAVGTQLCILSIVVDELHVAANNTKIMSVSQQRLDGKTVNGNNANYTYRFLKEKYIPTKLHLFARCI